MSSRTSHGLTMSGSGMHDTIDCPRRSTTPSGTRTPAVQRTLHTAHVHACVCTPVRAHVCMRTCCSNNIPRDTLVVAQRHALSGVALHPSLLQSLWCGVSVTFSVIILQAAYACICRWHVHARMRMHVHVHECVCLPMRAVQYGVGQCRSGPTCKTRHCVWVPQLGCRATQPVRGSSSCQVCRTSACVCCMLHACCVSICAPYT